MRNKKTQIVTDTETEEKIDFEALVNGVVDLDRLMDRKILEQYNYDELKEIIQYIDEIDNKELYDQVIETIRQKVPLRIRKASLGHRIWSFYYERYLLRILYLIWAGIAFFMIKPNMSGYLIVGPNEIPRWIIIMVIGALVLFNGWHAVMAFLESRLNHFFNKTTYFRRNLRIYVVNEDGGRISLLKSLLRSVFKTLLLGPISILYSEFDSNGRGLHDRLLNTYVLRITSPDDVDDMKDEIAVFIETNY